MGGFVKVQIHTGSRKLQFAWLTHCERRLKPAATRIKHVIVLRSGSPRQEPEAPFNNATSRGLRREPRGGAGELQVAGFIKQELPLAMRSAIFAASLGIFFFFGASFNAVSRKRPAEISSPPAFLFQFLVKGNIFILLSTFRRPCRPCRPYRRAYRRAFHRPSLPAGR